MCTELLRKYLHNSFIFKYVVFVCSISALVCAEEMVLVSAVNRGTGDFYYFSGMSEYCGHNYTYLVDERQCVSDHDLINNCTYVIVPRGSRTPQRILVNINMTGTKSKIILETVDKSLPPPHIATAIVAYTDTLQQDSTSDCHIDSLEVYRGKNHAFDVRHDGFNITNERTIQINTNYLRYDIEELKGELFRMYLSCSGGSGCLFFKVKGEANITNAKFGGMVPGTVTGKHTQHSEITTQSTSALALSTDTADLSVAVLDIATYAILAIAGVLILLFVTVLTATVWFFCCTKDKRKRYG